ncbi:MAG: Rpn family recombination-promoting nuclease/putative transposase [Chlorobium sp.]|jgi:predicted transposase/invertase (TIGR01784 family)|nr:Rpn family recombination-promoting nuclease/putative transposase [Chlorobium sp.]
MNPRSPRKLISFDWAMKRLLRSKANFEILEGFLSELLGEDILILEILESESNKESKSDKFNRVDLKVKESKGEIIIIEVQFEREYDYLQRMLYGTSRVITEHQKEGEAYSKLIKVISVNILYFDLGHGTDYIYHGTTTFTGIHDHDKLELDTRQQKQYGKSRISDIYPDYYLIKVNNFNRMATTSLDEWIYFLKNEEIKDEFKAKGIQKAKESFSLLRMTDEELRAYNSYQDSLRDQASYVETNYDFARMEGKEEGIGEGLRQGIELGIEQGLEKGKLEVARRLVAKGMSDEEAAAIAGIDAELLRH